jgi:hypothetical protein
VTKPVPVTPEAASRANHGEEKDADDLPDVEMGACGLGEKNRGEREIDVVPSVLKAQTLLPNKAAHWQRVLKILQDLDGAACMVV